MNDDADDPQNLISLGALRALDDAHLALMRQLGEPHTCQRCGAALHRIHLRSGVVVYVDDTGPTVHKDTCTAPSARK